MYYLKIFEFYFKKDTILFKFCTNKKNNILNNIFFPKKDLLDIKVTNFIKEFKSIFFIKFFLTNIMQLYKLPLKYQLQQEILIIKNLVIIVFNIIIQR